MLLRTAILGVGVRQYRRRGRSGKAGAANWVLTHLPTVAAWFAFLYVWVVSDSLAVALLAALGFPLLVVAIYVGYRTRTSTLTPRQSLEELWVRWRLPKQWSKAMKALGVTSRLPLRRIRSDGRGDFTALVHAGQAGIIPDKMVKSANSIAPIMKSREIEMQPVGFTGTLQVTFLRSDPLRDTIRPSMLPKAPSGMAPFGMSTKGKIVALPVLNGSGETIFTPLLAGGVTGSGKSSFLWSLLGGFIVAEIPVRLRVIDPAGGTELAALAEAVDKNTSGLLTVHRYTNKVGDAPKIVKEMISAMNCRMASMAGNVRLHKPTEKEPLDLLVNDEFLRMPNPLKSIDGELADMLSLGRKAGFSAVALSQIGHADALGRVRELFPRRICFATRSREQTIAVMGSGMENVAPAHDISESRPGEFYMVGDNRHFVHGRVAYYGNQEIKQVAHGHLPFGLENPKATTLDPHAVYWLYEAAPDQPEGKVLAYIGETNNMDRRMKEHAQRSWWFDRIDMSLSKVVWYDEGEEHAKRVESDEIHARWPKYNRAENQNNPTRRTKVTA